MFSKSVYGVAAISVVLFGYAVGVGASAPRAASPPSFVGQVLAGGNPSTKFPPASTENFMSLGQIIVQPGCAAKGPTYPISLAGDVSVLLSGLASSSGHSFNRQTLMNLRLIGYNSLFGAVTVTLMPSTTSTGSNTGPSLTNNFPVNSFFDVFTKITMTGGQFPAMSLYNPAPMRLRDATVETFPPFGSAYQLQNGPVSFYAVGQTPATGAPIACVVSAVDSPSMAGQALLSEQMTYDTEMLKGINP
jgi:hypothetical protein